MLHRWTILDFRQSDQLEFEADKTAVCVTRDEGLAGSAPIHRDLLFGMTAIIPTTDSCDSFDSSLNSLLLASSENEKRVTTSQRNLTTETGGIPEGMYVPAQNGDTGWSSSPTPASRLLDRIGRSGSVRRSRLHRNTHCVFVNRDGLSC